MEHKKELEDLNKKSLEKLDEYLSTKGNLNEEHHKKLNAAKKNGKVPGPILWMFLCTWKRWKYNSIILGRGNPCGCPNSIGLPGYICAK